MSPNRLLYLIEAGIDLALYESFKTTFYFISNYYESSLPWKTLPRHLPFVQAEGDSTNPGIWNKNGTLKLTPHHPFVDDTCLADTRTRLPGAIHASLQSLFMTFGYPREDQVAALSVEKFKEVVFGERQIQLGFLSTPGI